MSGNWWKKARVVVWGEEPPSREEKVLLFKIDGFILSYSCLGFFLNYLDRSNFNMAYVSGMKEDLNFQGNQFNQPVLTVGYVVGQIPCSIIIQKVRPRIFLPACQVVWGALTLLTCTVTSVGQLMALRFLLGLFEASTFSGVQYVLGSWYKGTEIGKRTSLFSSSGIAGTMFAGILQAAIYQSMNGLRGLAGWKWLFIIDGVVTFPIAIWGYVAFPDTPTSTNSFFLTAAEKKLAVDRLPKQKRVQTKLSWRLGKEVLLSWKYHVFVGLWVIGGVAESFGLNSLMALWLKDEGTYTVAQINHYPLGWAGVAIFSTLVMGVVGDATGKRWIGSYVIAVGSIIASAIILAWDVPKGAKYFAYYLAGIAYCGQVTYFSWANEVLAGDDQKRVVTLYAMNMMSSVFTAWWGLAFYPATDAPKFKLGMIIEIAISVVLALWTTGILFLIKREKRKTEHINPADLPGDDDYELEAADEKAPNAESRDVS